MPGGRTDIIANGAELIAVSTIGAIPKIAGITPPTLNDSIMLQGLDGAVNYIQVGAVAVSAVGATAQFRTKGGIISEGLGVDTLVIGRAASAGNAANLRGIAIGTLANCNTNDSVVIGYNASAATTGSVAIGYQSGATATEAITIGANAFGQGNAGGASVIAIGTSANAQASAAGGQDSLAIGGTSVARAYDTVLGYGAQSNVQSVFGNKNTVVGRQAKANIAQGNAVVIGADASTLATLAVAIGQLATVTAAGTKAIVIGQNSAIAHDQNIIIGHGAASFQANTAQLGGPNSIINTLVIGAGNTLAGTAAKTVRFTNASGADNAAGSVTWQAPLSTGAAAVAKHIFQTGIAHASDAVVQTPTTILELDAVSGGNFGTMPITAGAASFTTIAGSGDLNIGAGQFIVTAATGAVTGASYTASVAADTSAAIFKATSSGDRLDVVVRAAGNGVQLNAYDTGATDYASMLLQANGYTFKSRNGVGTTTDVLTMSSAQSTFAGPLAITGALTGVTTLNLTTQPAFVAGDKYLVIDAAGNVHVSALGPVS